MVSDMMNVHLIKAEEEQAGLIWQMQIASFAKLYEKYRDTQTSPGAEPLEKVLERFRQPFTQYYLIEWNNRIAGAVRVADQRQSGKLKRISPIFVLPEYQKRGIAQAAIAEVEKLHGSDGWELETILEEPGLCHLYEKAGYVRTGRTEKLNEHTTLVFYQKNV